MSAPYLQDPYPPGPWSDEHPFDPLDNLRQAQDARRKEAHQLRSLAADLAGWHADPPTPDDIRTAIRTLMTTADAVEGAQADEIGVGMTDRSMRP